MTVCVLRCDPSLPLHSSHFFFTRKHSGVPFRHFPWTWHRRLAQTPRILPLDRRHQRLVRRPRRRRDQRQRQLLLDRAPQQRRK